VSYGPLALNILQNYGCTVSADLEHAAKDVKGLLRLLVAHAHDDHSLFKGGDERLVLAKHRKLALRAGQRHRGGFAVKKNFVYFCNYDMHLFIICLYRIDAALHVKSALGFVVMLAV